jgi:hypothetical protein
MAWNAASRISPDPQHGKKLFTVFRLFKFKNYITGRSGSAFSRKPDGDCIK